MKSTRYSIMIKGVLSLICFSIFLSTAHAQRNRFLRDSKEIIAVFRNVVEEASESTVVIQADGKDIALGTIVSDDGYILTKQSELQANPKCKLKSGKVYDAELIGEHERYDLAMLKIDAENLKPIQWSSSAKMEAGDWVTTVGIDRDPIAIGVVSVPTRKMPNIPLPGARPGGYLGVYLSEEDNGLRISRVTKDSGADKAGMKPADTIVKVDGRQMKDRNELLGLLSRRKAGQKIQVEILRNTKKKVLDVTLGKRPADLFNRGDFQNRMGSELSGRRFGFPQVLQHDTVVKPNQCGGPLINLDGKAIGINIARAGRTESYAVPSEELKTIILDLKSGKLAPKK